MIVDFNQHLIFNKINFIFKNIFKNTILNENIISHIYSFILPNLSIINTKNIQILYTIDNLYLSKYNLNYTLFINKFINCIIIKKNYFNEPDLFPYKTNDIYYFIKNNNINLINEIDNLNYLQLFIFIYHYWFNNDNIYLYQKNFDVKFNNFVNNYFNNFIYI